MKIIKVDFYVILYNRIKIYDGLELKMKNEIYESFRINYGRNFLLF